MSPWFLPVCNTFARKVCELENRYPCYKCDLELAASFIMARTAAKHGQVFSDFRSHVVGQRDVMSFLEVSLKFVLVKF
jgi:hypothetical protein